MAHYLLRDIPGVHIKPLGFCDIVIHLPNAISSGSMIALYADDCKTLRVIHVHTIMNHLIKISIIWPPELKEIK